jgi:hypothetical protein
MGPRKWLIRGIWPAGAYGVHGAEMKAQKSWNGFDLAVSVASGTPWLNTYEVDAPGPVIIFAGEGGKAAIVRRLRAICNGRGLKAEDLPIVVCARAPHLGNNAHLALFQEQTAHTKPRLVILDPLYLSAGGADGKDLYAMGALLERAQHTCEAHDASLFVITHYNRKEGTGPMRITGAGPAEWGRVLIGAKVISRHTNIETLATTVVLELDVIGGEIPDQGIRVRRDIHADDPQTSTRHSTTTSTCSPSRKPSAWPQQATQTFRRPPGSSSRHSKRSTSPPPAPSSSTGSQTSTDTASNAKPSVAT